MCPLVSSLCHWYHDVMTSSNGKFSALLVICAGNSPVPGECPAPRPVTRSFDAFFDLRLNKRFSKQSWGWWFETLSRPLWRHRNGDMGTQLFNITCMQRPNSMCARGDRGTMGITSIILGALKKIRQPRDCTCLFYIKKPSDVSTNQYSGQVDGLKIDVKVTNQPRVWGKMGTWWGQFGHKLRKCISNIRKGSKQNKRNKNNLFICHNVSEPRGTHWKQLWYEIQNAPQSAVLSGLACACAVCG